MIPIKVYFVGKVLTNPLISEVHSIPRIGEEWISAHGRGKVTNVLHYHDPEPTEKIQPPMIAIEVASE